MASEDITTEELNAFLAQHFQSGIVQLDGSLTVALPHGLWGPAAAIARRAIRAERQRDAFAIALGNIAGGPLQEDLCASPTRRMEHIMGSCLHCKARTALKAATAPGAAEVG